MLFALMVGGVWLALFGIRRFYRAFCGSVNIEVGLHRSSLSQIISQTFGILLAVFMSYYCYSGNPELFASMVSLLKFEKMLK